MSADLSIAKGADGGLYLVAEVDGAKIPFASVNPSEVAAHRVEQGLDPAPENASAPHLGAYTGPAADATPSPHLESASASSASSGSSEPTSSAAQGETEPPSGF